MDDFVGIAVTEIQKLKQLADRALAQVDDYALFHALDPESNSLAVLVKHMGGNLRSRWTDFLTTDGEKPDRDRDDEFELGVSDTRTALTARWDAGWDRFIAAVRELGPDDLGATVRIRGEEQTAQAAVLRALSHAAQHVGQIVYLAKHLAGARWQNLSVPRGRSAQFTSAVQARAETRDPDA